MVTKARRESTISLPNVGIQEIMIDRSPKKTDKEVIKELEKNLPNLPLAYLLDKKGFHYKNKTCAKFPTIYDININNIYWQETDTSNGTFYLYGAYLDVRKNNRWVKSSFITGHLVFHRFLLMTFTIHRVINSINFPLDSINKAKDTLLFWFLLNRLVRQ